MRFSDNEYKSESGVVENERAAERYISEFQSLALDGHNFCNILSFSLLYSVRILQYYNNVIINTDGDSIILLSYNIMYYILWINLNFT